MAMDEAIITMVTILAGDTQTSVQEGTMDMVVMVAMDMVAQVLEIWNVVLIELKRALTVVMVDGEEEVTTTDMVTEETTETHTVMQMAIIAMGETGSTVGTMADMEVTVETDTMADMEVT